jgi:arylsulfatase A-like enzyme
MNRPLCIVLVGLICSVLRAGPVEAQQRPNILWITCEDMSPHLGCYGDALVKTPHLDRLAEQGTRYTRMFSTAGVCAPSRAALITGMYQTATGTHHMRTQGQNIPNAPDKPPGIINYSRVLAPEVKCFSEYLRQAGYYCTNNEKTDYQFEPPLTAWDESGRKAHWRNRPKADQPFFSVVNLLVTHESQVWSRAKQALEVDPTRVIVPPYYPDTPTVRQDIARFLSNVNEMDRQVGAILAELAADGLADNTIVFFFSDHGDGLPFVKREVTHRGLWVPFIVKNPFTKAVGTDTLLHSFVDLAPTVLSLAGVPLPKHLQGQAFLGKQLSKLPRRYVFGARDRLDSEYDRVRSVFDGRYQYLKNFYPEKPYYMNVAFRLQQPMMAEMVQLKEQGKLNSQQMRWFEPKEVPDELYDLEQDPHQFNNLANKPDYAAKLAELKQALEHWKQTYSDWGDVPEKEMIAQQWPQGVQPTTQAPELRYRGRSVLLKSATAGASIAFKVIPKGQTESPTWSLYTKPIVVERGSIIKTLAIRIGYLPSPVVEKEM